MLSERPSPDTEEMFTIVAVTPDGLRALELVDDAHPRPVPWHEAMRYRN